MLFQASNDDQLGFQESFSKNQSKGDRPIASTRGLKLRIPQALVLKAGIPKTAYDKMSKSLVTLCDNAGLGLGLGSGSRLGSRLGLGLGLILGS